MAVGDDRNPTSPTQQVGEPIPQHRQGTPTPPRPLPPPPLPVARTSSTTTRTPTGGVSASGLDATFQERLEAFIAASGGRIRMHSGYRSREKQQALWDKSDKTGHWVARPGHSNHEKGIAGDLSDSNGEPLGPKADRATLQWAHDHAAEFGLYFPMSWEPWHIEPIGSRSGKIAGWSGATASKGGYTKPQEGHALADDPASSAPANDPRKSIDYQIAVLGSLLRSPDFVLADVPSGPEPDFASTWVVR